MGTEDVYEPRRWYFELPLLTTATERGKSLIEDDPEVELAENQQTGKQVPDTLQKFCTLQCLEQIDLFHALPVCRPIIISWHTSLPFPLKNVQYI